jgi:hypothetical protein
VESGEGGSVKSVEGAAGCSGIHRSYDGTSLTDSNTVFPNPPLPRRQQPRQPQSGCNSTAITPNQAARRSDMSQRQYMKARETSDIILPGAKSALARGDIS